MIQTQYTYNNVIYTDFYAVRALFPHVSWGDTVTDADLAMFGITKSEVEIVDVWCYYNNGLSVKTVKSDYLVADGEVLFSTTPTTEQLTEAFTEYATAVLAKAKLSKLAELYQSFSADRDATTWVVQADGKKYGYDRKTDDIVNFLAAMKRSELGQETYYKVYINDINTKQMVLHTADMFHTCLGQSANEQITAYTKFDTAKAKVQAATTIDAVNAVTYSTDIPAAG